MSEKAENLKDVMPTERKSMWKSVEERRISDLTRVLEWLERRQGKKKQAPQVQQSPKKDGDSVMYRKHYGMQKKAKRLSIVPGTDPGNYAKSSSGKSDLDNKDTLAMDSSPRGGSHRRQSSLDPIYPDSIFPPRKSNLMKDWATKTPDISYERKLMSLMEKGTEPKMEAVKMLKPEEVLSCRYLRLSKNNIKTLLKLCKDAGMDVDIHPHMTEGEINAKMVFAQPPNTAL
ncbi:PREDICTED: uncharacterized protein C16orf78 homolog [Chrysochloris asiatica]|uniref:Uncharacterized protein C16orf78 homolog n=1 Tax=Chrysochloris asiatica TaxID=185453 RepID=A0A9B0U6J6_CHRAS|nr:PREDICTED: uncharacterized protein C16orf78 homolog [Chrysochloris asiatica]